MQTVHDVIPVGVANPERVAMVRAFLRRCCRKMTQTLKMGSNGGVGKQLRTTREAAEYLGLAWRQSMRRPGSRVKVGWPRGMIAGRRRQTRGDTQLALRDAHHTPILETDPSADCGFCSSRCPNTRRQSGRVLDQRSAVSARRSLFALSPAPVRRTAQLGKIRVQGR